MREQGDVTRYLQVAALLPSHLRRQAEGLDKADQTVAEELRLRAGRPMAVVCPTGEQPLPGRYVRRTWSWWWRSPPVPLSTPPWSG